MKNISGFCEAGGFSYGQKSTQLCNGHNDFDMLLITMIHFIYAHKQYNMIHGGVSKLYR